MLDALERRAGRRFESRSIIFFDTGIAQAYEFVERLTHAQWYAAGVMRSLHRYDEYAGHKEEHEQLLDELRDLMDDYESGVWVDMESFGARIGEWFSLHFRTRDARLHRRLG